MEETDTLVEVWSFYIKTDLSYFEKNIFRFFPKHLLF